MLHTEKHIRILHERLRCYPVAYLVVFDRLVAQLVAGYLSEGLLPRLLLGVGSR